MDQNKTELIATQNAISANDYWYKKKSENLLAPHLLQ